MDDGGKKVGFSESCIYRPLCMCKSGRKTNESETDEPNVRMLRVSIGDMYAFETRKGGAKTIDSTGLLNKNQQRGVLDAETRAGGW